MRWGGGSVAVAGHFSFGTYLVCGGRRDCIARLMVMYIMRIAAADPLGHMPISLLADVVRMLGEQCGWLICTT